MPGPTASPGIHREIWGQHWLDSCTARGLLVWPELEAVKTIHAACFPIAQGRLGLYPLLLTPQTILGHSAVTPWGL